ncbi:hypothetical protein LshimejAT787_0201170 [Lyophyllum shimeji]|uniref:Uncharacterized protein n=1 Tax=Lyophyllum shimeji TaxID=47721 RepID=A0A9P3PEP3_LYOSH|nr:hypothetical protein LshimejAT787_0201170 [Lyophyllum shimeji]
MRCLAHADRGRRYEGNMTAKNDFRTLKRSGVDTDTPWSAVYFYTPSVMHNECRSHRELRTWSLHSSPGPHDGGRHHKLLVLTMVFRDAWTSRPSVRWNSDYTKCLSCQQWWRYRGFAEVSPSIAHIEDESPVLGDIGLLSATLASCMQTSLEAGFFGGKLNTSCNQGRRSAVSMHLLQSNAPPPRVQRQPTSLENSFCSSISRTWTDSSHLPSSTESSYYLLLHLHSYVIQKITTEA